MSKTEAGGTGSTDLLEEITRYLVDMTRLEFDHPPTISGHSSLDAVAAGLVALGEELQASVVAREVAEAANRSKGEFLANVSHELRTPLTTIVGSSDLIDTTELSPFQSHLFRQINESANLLRRLICDILDFSSVQAGSLEFRSQPFDLRGLVEDTVDRHRQAAVTQGVTLRVALLPVALVALGDEDRIQQVLGNLLSNAIKYTPEGWVEVRLVVEPQDPDLVLRFEVEDTGIGIADELKEAVFERFVQADKTRSGATGGMGLGLAICKGLVEGMGGEIGLKSQLGEGATFWFQLALPRVSMSDEREPQAVAPLSRRILVVDDNDQVRSLTAEMLEVIGCEVLQAASGRAALDLLKTEIFDLILMDCQMSPMDGLEATRQALRTAAPYHLRIVALTANATNENLERCLKAGMIDCLTKPYTLADLRDKVFEHTL